MKKDADRKEIVRVVIGAVLIITGITLGLLLLFGDGGVTVEEIIDISPENKYLAAVIMLMMFAGKSLTVVFPFWMLFIVSGCLFGVPVGIAVDAAGIAAAVTIPYWIGRMSGKAAVVSLTVKYPKLRRINEMQRRNGFIFVLLVRLIGVIPGDVTSMYMGSSSIHYWGYLAASVLGILPSAVLITLMGESAAEPWAPEFWISGAAQILLAAVSALIYRAIQNHAGHSGRNKKEA